ncbi:helix-turn-helix transcriptional regulator [Elongatibacter sediminis]|uniref:Helix-turn-helix transcriptional regulator n=1 Tax=Elongatibacter sediminis TaxID=3119006 RepID=A0AAW9RC15_9GAMM
MGLFQSEVADLLEVNTWTFSNWEKGRTQSPFAVMPAVFRLLGHDPYPKPRTLPEHLLAKRREMGWAIKQAAWAIGVDSSIWRNWENGQMILYRKHRVAVANALNLSMDALDEQMAIEWRKTHGRVRFDAW